MSRGGICLPSLTGSADAFLCAVLAGRGGTPPKPVVAITPGIPSAERLFDDLNVLGTETYEFPVPSEKDLGAFGTRLKTISALKSWSSSPRPMVVVAPFAALAAPVTETVAPTIDLRPGKDGGTFSSVSAKLAEYGYNRVAQVEKEGDYSVRGGIVDVWSPGEDFPVRAEFFGDDLESLRRFSADTQVSVGKMEHCEITGLSGGGEKSSRSLLDMLPEESVLIAFEHFEYAAGADLAAHRVVYTGEPAPPGTAEFDFQTSPLPGFSAPGASRTPSAELFEAAVKRLDGHIAGAKKKGSLIAAIDSLSGGFELPGKDGFAGLVVVTKADRAFGRKRLRRPKRTGGGARFDSFDDLEPGEYVVHVDHGIGRYIGSSEISVDGKLNEVFTVEYADGGKLHVPAAHAHLLSRYIGVKGEAVKMHRLDGKRWLRNKIDAERSIADLAASLLETQAKRETAGGYAFDVDCDGIDAFEAAFPYEETEDQMRAIEEVKNDMSRTRPMDRLICGDAGYGKTEVAMRAAFISAMNGKQVAVLAPTTVLAEQHFETFVSRFDSTPIRIEAMSRFQSPAAREETFKRMKSGVCDIVIGTHALLAGKTSFRDLGLVIIDEEQRFGVKHKEFLKRLRSSADILTLSATPIPRTLYLSMTGVRDMSLIRTPPRERVAVETKIVLDSDETVRKAVEAELERGGQVFFLHNRVHSIGKIGKRLKALCPKARIVTAHGQMGSGELSGKIRGFERGEHDILLSTTIIESGIDIPRANTILIDRADTFGMAELYQLRGRVGRSSKRGYAYFLLPPSGDVDSDARERLAALKRHGSLGSGFNLAVRDLELRGAGNLLGSQQSGHIAAVGFSLYCQLLKRTVALMKGEKPQETVDVRLNLDFSSARISQDYIEDDSQRFSLMKRFAEASDENDVKKLSSEMRDRFGPIPPETLEYVKSVSLRIAAARAGIRDIDVKDSRAVFYAADSGKISFVGTLKSANPLKRLDELIRMTRSRRA